MSHCKIQAPGMQISRGLPIPLPSAPPCPNLHTLWRPQTMASVRKTHSYFVFKLLNTQLKTLEKRKREKNKILKLLEGRK